MGGLDLTDAQRTEIRSVVREYRGQMLEVRDEVQKAESDLDDVFNEETVDQRRGSEAIDRLSKARADMTRSVSEMSLRMRAVLTPQQWQELQQRQQEQSIEDPERGPRCGTARRRTRASRAEGWIERRAEGLGDAHRSPVSGDAGAGVEPAVVPIDARSCGVVS